jgi:toxin ParE1/3/4
VAKVVVTPSADADTARIIAHLKATAGYVVAARYSASFERLGIVPPYIVIYRHTEAGNVVRVLRIVHGSRRITGKMLRGGL